jgi:hypothetical protein
MKHSSLRSFFMWLQKAWAGYDALPIRRFEFRPMKNEWIEDQDATEIALYHVLGALPKLQPTQGTERTI